MKTDRRRKVAIILVVVAVSLLAIGFLDPLRETTEPTTTDVNPEQSPSTIYEKSLEATFTGPYTAKYTRYNGTQKTRILERQVYEVSSSGMASQTTYKRSSQVSKKWAYSESYRGEHTYKSVFGSTNTLGETPEFLTVDPRFYNSVVGPPQAPDGTPQRVVQEFVSDPSALKVIEITDSKIILGTDSKDRYLKVTGIDYEKTRENVTSESSVRVHIDRETGRITKFTHRFHRTNRNGYESFKLTEHGPVTVERPGWANRNLLEYLLDFLFWS